MKFTPRKARDDVNVSKEHPLVEASTLVVGVGLIFVTIIVGLMFAVEIALYFVPADKEVAMFDSWIPDDIVTVADDDPRRGDLAALLERLVRHWPETEYRFRIEIDDSPELNALALPGGLIVITSGLLDRIGSENELAFVVGHELGHFHNRDHLRGLGRGVVLGIVFAAIGSGDGAAALGSTISDLALRGFSRRQETSADRFGLGLVAAEYGHVADAWRFFERLNEEGYGYSDVVAYIATHPAPSDRIDAMIEEANVRGWSLSGPVTAVSW